MTAEHTRPDGQRDAGQPEPPEQASASEQVELAQLRALYAQEQSRVRELEASQQQLELYANDLRRTFSELRRQLAHMNELHRISSAIGSVLDPNAVMARTLEGLDNLVDNQAACIYLLDGDRATQAARQGRDWLLPPADMLADEDPVARVLIAEGDDAISADGQSLTVGMRAGGVMIGALHLRRDHGAALTNEDRKLVELVATEAAAAIHNARLYEQTQRLATTDPLTGLFNYRYFRDALSMEVARANRLEYPVGLLMIDCDNFKRVNDTFGHPVGDSVLRDVATALRHNLRQTDVAARYGGEEFSIILPGLGPRGVRAVGEKLRHAVRRIQPLESEGQGPLPITISLGGVSLVPPSVDAVELVRLADAALYQAKRRGKDRVCIVPEAPEQDERPANRQETIDQTASGHRVDGRGTEGHGTEGHGTEGHGTEGRTDDPGRREKEQHEQAHRPLG
ncbi:MAG: diguanylate cyclase [Chloroflexi bacterium]|nr:diguanylate cyclase [Chloroflexota bacterium]